MVTGTHQYSILQQNNNLDETKNLNEDNISSTTIIISESLLDNNVTKQQIQKENENFTGSVFSLYNGKQRTKKKILGSLDIFISFVVVGPCVVGGWRGTWELFLIYRHIFEPAQSFMVGTAIHLVLAILQDTFQDIVKEIKENDSLVWKIILWFLLKAYICVFYMSTLLTWYGGWECYDILLGIKIKPDGTAIREGSEYSTVIFVIITILLMLLKVLRNVNSVPFEIALDQTDEILVFPSYFRTKAGDKTSLYILDCLFSVLVVGTLVVFVWRGAWVLIDIFLFPEDEKLSAWGSLILGYITVAIAFLMQPMMRWICDRATGASRLFVADFFILFAFFGTVNVWRGIWNLLNLYFLPDNLELSCWITHWVCLVILVLLGCSNSLLVRGVYIDAEEPAGKCVVFPCYYLRVIFQQEKMKNKNPTIPMQEKIKPTQDSEKKIYENNHIINVSTIESNMENHAKS